MLSDNANIVFNLINKLHAEKVKVIAVSKTQPISSILEVYNSGHKIFGENRVQELVEKHKQLPSNIEWHMIGHLQTNKVKFVVPFIHLIHSVDSFKLLDAIDKEGIKNKKKINCLLQIHIAQEETKYGFSFEETIEVLSSAKFISLQNINISGLMGIATFTSDREKIRQEFRSLNIFFMEIKKNFFPKNPQFKELSMGMSGDYQIAIEEGSTMVRIGSLIFGERVNK